MYESKNRLSTPEVGENYLGDQAIFPYILKETYTAKTANFDNRQIFSFSKTTVLFRCHAAAERRYG